MADKSEFSTDEWSRLLASVFLSAMAISAAEPSGIIGLIQEGLAGGRVLQEEAKRPDPSLIRAIALEAGTPEGRLVARDAIHWRMDGAPREQICMRAVSGLRQAMMLLNAKAPDEAPALAALLVKIAEATAEAAVEGGFLGFGGERVTAAERATIAEIKQAVGLA